MEIQPDGPGISCQDTDLSVRSDHSPNSDPFSHALAFFVPYALLSWPRTSQVDFATPKGYVEPSAPPPKPTATMASKLNINVNSTDAPGSGASSASGRGDVAVDAAEAAFEAFVGGGRTLNGRRTKGKGLAKKIEEVDPASIIRRTECVLHLFSFLPAFACTQSDADLRNISSFSSKSRMVPLSALSTSNDPVPAALHLPPGKLFFAWQYKPFDPNAPLPGSAAAAAPSPPAVPFAGLSSSGTTLSGRAPRAFPTPSTATSSSSASSSNVGSTSSTPKPGAPVAKPDEDGKPAEEGPVDPWAKLTGGNSLRGSGGGGGKGKGRETVPQHDVIEID
jgi:ubiquitin fusion degradation protein 1